MPGNKSPRLATAVFCVSSCHPLGNNFASILAVSLAPVEGSCHLTVCCPLIRPWNQLFQPLGSRFWHCSLSVKMESTWRRDEPRFERNMCLKLEWGYPECIIGFTDIKIQYFLSLQCSCLRVCSTFPNKLCLRYQLGMFVM